MNQNGGIHKGGFAVLCHRNGGSESPGILSNGTYAESIVERFAHNTIWVETGDVNMRQYLSHA